MWAGVRSAGPGAMLRSLQHIPRQVRSSCPLRAVQDAVRFTFSRDHGLDLQTSPALSICRGPQSPTELRGEDRRGLHPQVTSQVSSCWPETPALDCCGVKINFSFQPRREGGKEGGRAGMKREEGRGREKEHSCCCAGSRRRLAADSRARQSPSSVSLSVPWIEQIMFFREINGLRRAPGKLWDEPRTNCLAQGCWPGKAAESSSSRPGLPGATVPASYLPPQEASLK